MIGQSTDNKWERLVLVYSLWDGPKCGIVTYQDVPHFFCCPFDDEAQDFPDFYWLSPLPPELFSSAYKLLELKKVDRRQRSEKAQAEIRQAESVFKELHMDEATAFKAKYELRWPAHLEGELYFPISDEWEIRFFDDSAAS